VTTGNPKEEPISTTFMAIADYAIKTGQVPIKNKMWIVKLDEHWEFAVNGFNEERETGPFGQAQASHSIPPFTVYVEFNGWPAGFINPYSGVFAAGSAANEKEFCDALKRAIPS